MKVRLVSERDDDEEVESILEISKFRISYS